MSLAQRIKQAREQTHLSQRELAKRSGISQQLISKLENGLVESTSEIFKLAAALSVDPRWLATGEEIPEAHSTMAYVPLVSWVAAGGWRDIAQASEQTLVPVSCRVSKNAFALRVQGDSMEPKFPDGCIIVIEPAGEARTGSYIVLRLDDSDQATFKQLIIDGGVHYLKPLNPRYPVIEIKESATICGVVKHMLMDFD